ncbi:MAG: stage II sporulation protein M [Dysgonamonadaceae bacterium]|jgi:uncharacterized membrane protein SpoIIM required for sporulation|nr:stage II sporulation protein M [Dysgonamonadaceae bacterium]
MKEAFFIRRNRVKWKRYEGCLRNIEQQSPDFLAEIYIDLTNDLSFAQSHFQHSRICFYLNSLSIRLHQFINRKKKENFSRILTYWTQEVPLVMYHARKELLYAFLIFAVSVCIGVFSTANDPDFSRLVLGDRYVDMTLINIAIEDPMAVYKQMSGENMFWGISINNINVSFKAFISGIFTSVATAYLLFRNGVMVGTFQYFFYDYGLLEESFLAIWLHGTLEISAVVVAGAAGIAMGNGWLFPGTYTRIVSFRRGARKGLKIIVGTIPVFVLAALLESFVTRHTEFSNWIRLAIILFSLGFVIFYYIVYPRKIGKNTEEEDLFKL